MVVSASRTTQTAGLASGSGAGACAGAGGAAVAGAAAVAAWKAKAGVQARAKASAPMSSFFIQISLSRCGLAEFVEEGSEQHHDQQDGIDDDMLRLGHEPALPEQEPDRIADQEERGAD